jgi:hypothetical protein
LGKFKVYSKILLKQIATKFKKPVVYEIPRCGVSFTKMTKLADEVKGIKIVKEQDTKSTIFKIKSKAPEIVFALVSQMSEFILPSSGSPSKKDKQKLMELGAYIKKLHPLIKNLDLYKEYTSYNLK